MCVCALVSRYVSCAHIGPHIMRASIASLRFSGSGQNERIAASERTGIFFVGTSSCRGTASIKILYILYLQSVMRVHFRTKATRTRVRVRVRVCTCNMREFQLSRRPQNRKNTIATRSMNHGTTATTTTTTTCACIVCVCVRVRA